MIIKKIESGVILKILRTISAIILILLLSGQLFVYAGNYNRADWNHWIDYDSDCQDSRTETLIRDSISPVIFKSKGKDCEVRSGKWICPYTWKVFTNPTDIDIDHIVPLSNAHRSGAESWTKEEREAFANDPENLLAVEDNANRAKGDRGPEAWRPPIKECWPEYARHWMYIKLKYSLTLTPAENKAISDMLR